MVAISITYQEIKPEELKAGLVTAGLPGDYADFLLMIFGFLREGYNAAQFLEDLYLNKFISGYNIEHTISKCYSIKNK